MIAKITLLCFSLALMCVTNPADARSAVTARDEPWNFERIDRLPTEIRNSVIRRCRDVPKAARYFVTYFNNSKLVRLHFEHFYCDSAREIYRSRLGCLHQDFALSGSRYLLARSYLADCND